MAVFSTAGVGYNGSFVFDSSPGLNAYSFFEHPLRYSHNGLFGGLIYVSAYSPTLIEGAARAPLSAVTGFDGLTGTGLTVQTTGDFALTGGTVTGFGTGTDTSGFPSNAFETATGFSIAAVTFWSLASTGQWHALWLLASAGDDTMTGSNVAASPDFIEGGAGSDLIYARAGDDSVWGNAGRDVLFGGDGKDTIVCNDWAAGAVSAFWSEGHGDAGDDLVFTGGYGSGFLEGGAGGDRLWGGPQSDFLSGGTGIDYMTGGLGLDVFEVTAAGAAAGEYDFILDFQDGVDFIKLPVGPVWSAADSAYGAILSAPGSSFYVIVTGATVAMISDQIYYV
jgi:Ca2+-binding RTX toxin-like protein